MRPTPEQIMHNMLALSEQMQSMEKEEPDADQKAFLASRVAYLVWMIRSRYRITSTYWITAEQDAYHNFRNYFGAIDDDD